jgi:hypothetical protein
VVGMDVGCMDAYWAARSLLLKTSRNTARLSTTRNLIRITTIFRAKDACPWNVAVSLVTDGKRVTTIC